jgi:ketosteroid isomerase-like protein
MSEENVEVLRAFYAAWNAGDMGALRELHDPSVIMHAPAGWPEPGPEVGRDAVMRQFERLRTAWDADWAEPIGEFVDAGDRTLVRFIWHAAGKGPGSHMEFTHVATVRNGRIFLNEYFWDHREARRAAGLLE